MEPFIVCILFVALLSGALGASQDLAFKWEEFKAKHGKQYPSHEEAERMQRFAERHAEIEAHNARYAAGLENFSRQLNHYSDLSDEELGKHAFGFISDIDEATVFWNDSNVLPSLPVSFNWKHKGAMTPVKDQRICGACYAFASVALLESHLKIKTQKEYDFSEQDIIDCTFKKYRGNNLNKGCDGGSPSVAFEYVIGKGIALESSYPFTSGNSGKEGTCKSSRINSLGNKKPKMSRVFVKNEEDLAKLLFIAGPLVVGIGVDNYYERMFSELGDGVFEVPDGSEATPNHIVLLVGYGIHTYHFGFVSYDKPYWYFKNSWGTSWGVEGYGKLARGNNMGNILLQGAWFLES